MSDDEFDVFPDDFADMQDVDWARLLGGPSASNTESGHESTRSGFQNTDLPVIQAGPSSPNSSPDYFGHDYDDLDPAFLAELDRVEQQVVQAPHVSRPSYVPRGTMSREAVAEAVSRGAGTSSSVRVSGAAYVSQSLLASGARTSPYFLTLNPQSPHKRKDVAANEARSVEKAPDSSSKRVRAENSPDRKGKGKMKVDCDMLQILLEYEEDLSCPICYDILVAAHVGNPCGHSFCGDCGWKWHVENKNKECPVCRTTLEKSGPLIPNIKMDRTVETHLKTLALAGDQDWEPGGRKMKEWDIRKEAWKKGAADRARKKASGPRRARTFVPSVQVFDIETIHEALGNGRWVQVGDNVDEDPTYEDSDVELIPRPIRRVRRRRRDE